MMKIAIVHDQLREFGGAERVLVSLKKIFPQADIYTSGLELSSLGTHQELIKNWPVKISWFGKIPLIKNFYSPLRFLTPFIWESFDFSNYNLVISSSGSYMSKGIITRPETIHICYLHHPPRYLYYYETAIEWQKYWPVRIYAHLINKGLRIWDYLSSQRVDYFIANSNETKKRINKFYRRDAQVIYPPVNIPQKIDLKNWLPAKKNKGYYLTVSRLARAKHIDVLIRAANKKGFPLKIVGQGRAEKNLKKIAGKSVEFLGNISDQQLTDLYTNANAFLFASRDEEFGIAPVEAMGRGLPIIAFQSGGVPEYINEGKNGFLFKTLDENALIKKINAFENLSAAKVLTMKKEARQTATKFSEEEFKKQILAFVNQVSPQPK